MTLWYANHDTTSIKGLAGSWAFLKGCVQLFQSWSPAGQRSNGK